jgi:outer membrane receptor protein involved in Fe transport
MNCRVIIQSMSDSPHDFHLPEKYGQLRVRFDVTNIFDQSYQLRNGTGIGVFAPQFGPRRGFFGGVSRIF